MDDVDLKITLELIEDARKPFSNIAKKLGVSTQTVTRRYDTLVKTGIICPKITINPKKLGYVGSARLFISSSSGKTLAETLKKLKKTPGVYIVTRALGNCEVFAVMLFKSYEDFDEKINNIKKSSDVGKIEVLIHPVNNHEIPRKTTIKDVST